MFDLKNLGGGIMFAMMLSTLKVFYSPYLFFSLFHYVDDFTNQIPFVCQNSQLPVIVT